ncbi:MAG: Gfo/Idh/MocA family oxidoreductase, partial [Rhodospirillales bacterium]|nr:Gfo/Idh/MocA family oxidoreductase [Rhodospirillales bacterium]
MARHIKYQAHAQVLRDHPDFDWQAVIDPDPQARRAARDDWGIPIAVARPQDLPPSFEPEVAILAVPPAPRSELVRDLPTVKALVVEKPLGDTFARSLEFARIVEA